MSRHYDKAMTKLTSKEKEAVLERGLRRAIEEGLHSIADGDHGALTALAQRLHSCADPRQVLVEIIKDACRLPLSEAHNAALQAQLDALTPLTAQRLRTVAG